MARERNVAFAVLFGGALFITICAVVIYIVFALVSEREVSFGEAVAVVDIKGEIFYDLRKVEEIEQHRDNDNVKAILLHIYSPGGGVAASQEIHRAVEKAREEKPIVACLGPLAASGGYYVACAADSIVAQEGTLTGSIGVIASFIHTEELFEKIGLDITVIKSGKYKDTGSPHREMTEEEREYMGDLLDTVYQQFLRAVSEGRQIPMDVVGELAEGRLYTGETALAAGLVDRIGTFEDALEIAGRMGGISGKPRMIKKRRKQALWERFLGAAAANLPIQAEDRVALKYIIP
jgi:protease-4